MHVPITYNKTPIKNTPGTPGNQYKQLLEKLQLFNKPRLIKSFKAYDQITIMLSLKAT